MAKKDASLAKSLTTRAMKNNLLHENARESLKTHIANTLSSCIVNNGIIKFDLTKATKYIDEAKKHKKEWMRDIDLYGLLYKQTKDYLPKNTEKRMETSGNLKDIIGEIEITSLTNKVIDYIESIPRKYHIFFKLPAAQGFGVNEIELTPDIAIVEGVDERSFPRSTTLTDAYASLYDYSHRKGQLYVRIIVDGYADGTFHSSAVRKAYSRFKQVILLSKLSGVLAEDQRVATLGLFGSRSITPQILISHVGQGIEKYSVNLPQTVSDYISKLRLNEDVLKPTEDETLFGEFEDGKPLTSSEKEKILIERLRHAIKLLKTSDNDENTESIKTAIEWTFDSVTNDNDTFAFIQACIGLEAILGDDGTSEKLMKTLADRCAYLLGGKISKRRKVRKVFENLYGIRSKLVHGRKANLDNEQLKFLRFAQDMLNSIILKEISYI